MRGVEVIERLSKKEKREKLMDRVNSVVIAGGKWCGRRRRRVKGE